jgi:hypothetical protein
VFGDGVGFNSRILTLSSLIFQSVANRFAEWNNGLGILGDNLASPAGAYTLQGPDNASANNTAGANLTLRSGLGRGTGTASYLSLNGSVAVGAGSGQHTVGESARAYGQYFALVGGSSQKRTTVNDANYTATLTDGRIAYTAIAAARVVTGPVTSSLPAGVNLEYRVADESGSAGVVNTITFTPASGTINGAASAVVVNKARGEAVVYFDGANWHSPSMQ